MIITLFVFQSFLAECDGKHRRHSASDDSLSQSVSEGSVHQPETEQKQPANTSNTYQWVVALRKLLLIFISTVHM